MRSANLISAVIYLALGVACLAFAFREQRRLRLLDPLQRTAPVANYRTLRVFGLLMLWMGASLIQDIFYGPN
jgi:hypothetical protein